MNLLQMLLGSLQQQNSVSNIANQSGASSGQIMKLITMALPLIMKYMTKNANKEGGAASLLGALGQHRSTNNIADQVENADVEDGNKIINHILGDDKKQVIGNLAEETGMEYSQVKTALGSMAPGIMSGVSAAADKAGEKKKKGVDLSDGIDMGDIMGLLGGVTGGSEGGGLGGLLGGLFGGGDKKKADKEPGAAKAAKAVKESASNGNDLLNMLAKLM